MSNATFSYHVSAILAAAVLLAGCSKPSPDTTVFVSGDTAGWITPCGCTSNQSGGLSRRDTLIQQSRSASPTLALDVGGNVAGDSPYDLTKLKAILRGLNQMKYDAVNLGGPESQFSVAEIRGLQTDLSVPLISTNLKDPAGKLIGKPMANVTVAGQTFAILGVVDPDRVGAAVVADDPFEAILRWMPKIKADRIVVLAYLDAPKLRELAKQLPEVDAVIGGPTGQVVPPTFVGSVLVSSSTNKGKFLLQTAWPALRESSNASANIRPTAKVVEVHSQLPLADRQQDNLTAFYAELHKTDFAPDQTTFISNRLVRDDAPKIAGSDSCAACHQVDDSVWHDSRHIHAWSALQQTGAHVDPACQRCHTTGYGDPGGFVSHQASTQRFNVGCENCHGPSSLHVANVTTRTPYDAKQQCIQCHDHENSPTFDFDSYWNKIKHGMPNDGTALQSFREPGDRS